MPTLTEKSQVTIPKKIRMQLGIRPGDEVEFIIEKNKAILKKKAKELPFNKWKSYLGKGNTDDLMKELR